MEKNKGKIKTKNLLVILILGISVIGVVIYGIAFSPLSDLSSRLYITGNDVITNYELTSFDGRDINYGIVDGLDNRLITEPGAFWTATEDDLEIIGEPTINGDQATVQYFVTFRNKVNIYTNVKLHQAVETNLREITETIDIGYYQHLSWSGPTRIYWESNLYWTHYDFGDVIDYNTRNNHFTGLLKAEFDINPNPTPLNFTDNDGNRIETQFDYISINAMYLSDRKHGKLSEVLPEIDTIVPAKYEQDEVNYDTGGGVGGTMIAEGSGDDYYSLWDPDITFTPANPQVVDIGLNPGTVGSTLYPKTKDGSNIWDPAFDQKSMEDCSFTYNLVSLSPLVYEYRYTLSWNNQINIIQDDDIWASDTTHLFHAEDRLSETRPVALHVTNRYVQMEFAVKFKIFTGLKINMAVTEEQDLDLPEEYYYELLWQALVDGFGGGEVYSESKDYDDIWMIVIVVIIISVGGVAGYMIYLKRNKQKFLLQLAGRR